MRSFALGAALALACVACDREPSRIDIGAAASLRHAMPEIVEAYRAKTGVRVSISYGSSDMLATQLERGASLDGVIFAEHGAIDRLIEHDRISANSKRRVATTTLVLVGPKEVEYRFATLASVPETVKIAIGDPASVPAGRYARDYLQALGAWSAIEKRLVYGGDVAGVLAHALRGTAQLAIIYRSDVEGAAPLVVLDAPPDAPTVHIVSGIANASADQTRAGAFFDFLASPQGQAILARHGFGPHL